MRCFSCVKGIFLSGVEEIERDVWVGCAAFLCSVDFFFLRGVEEMGLDVL
jgi:hypothetical protein